MIDIATKSGFGCRIVKTESSEFGHQFGGGQKYRGTIPAGGSKAVQLLFRLNLRDPRMPIGMSDLDWLPLFYPFQYDGCGMGYRVVGESEIEILRIENNQFTDGFPYAGYPDFFTRAPVELVSMDHEEIKVLAFKEFVERHGLDTELRDEDRELIRSLGAECTRIGRTHAFLQDRPRFHDCPNPRCLSRSEGWPNPVTFCTVWNEPIEGVDVWQADGEPIQIIYQICIDCGAIQTHNQCT